jgi:S1-C subfamily serine protease
MSSYDRNPPHYSPLSYLWPLLLVAVLVLAGLLVWRLSTWLMPGPDYPPPSSEAMRPREVTPRGDLANVEKTNMAIFEKCSPSVVHITSLTRQTNPYTLNVQQVPKGTGSGFIWNKDGYIVTNYHVVQDANAATVTLGDQTSYRARLVGTYPDKDIAVLQISAPADRLHPIEVGTSDDLKVGQLAFAIGNPFGLDQTFTTGVVSALNREIESVTGRPIRGVIQADAAINPGNSGGPLIDSAGRLIGMNTAIASPSGASAGIGFAIPVDEINRVVPELIAKGKVARPVLGVTLASDQFGKQNNLPGLLVLRVEPDGPADKAGMKPSMRGPHGLVLGDIIVGVQGKPTKTHKDLYLALDQFKVGETIKVQVLRDNKTVDLSVTLDAAG